MNILITGGSGFIGTHLIKQLRATHSITVLTRDPVKTYAKLGHDITALIDIAQIDFNEIDAVINLAGAPIADRRWSRARKQILETSRWDITEQLVAKINQAKSPPNVFISGSAIGFYGRVAGENIDEEHPTCHPEYSHYLCKKWENTAAKVNQSNTRLCIVRTGVVIGKRGGMLKKLLMPYKLGLGGPIGDGQQILSWIHIDDMVALLIAMLENENYRGVFNATAPQPTSNQTFGDTLAKQLHRPNLFRMPTKVAKAIFGEMSDILLYGQHVIPKKALDLGFNFTHATIEQALAKELSS